MLWVSQLSVSSNIHPSCAYNDFFFFFNNYCLWETPMLTAYCHCLFVYFQVYIYIYVYMIQQIEVGILIILHVGWLWTCASITIKQVH